MDSMKKMIQWMIHQVAMEVLIAMEVLMERVMEVLIVMGVISANLQYGIETIIAVLLLLLQVTG